MSSETESYNAPVELSRLSWELGDLARRAGTLNPAVVASESKRIGREVLVAAAHMWAKADEGLMGVERDYYAGLPDPESTPQTEPVPKSATIKVLESRVLKGKDEHVLVRLRPDDIFCLSVLMLYRGHYISSGFMLGLGFRERANIRAAFNSAMMRLENTLAILTGIEDEPSILRAGEGTLTRYMLNPRIKFEAVPDERVPQVITTSRKRKLNPSHDGLEPVEAVHAPSPTIPAKTAAGVPSEPQARRTAGGPQETAAAHTGDATKSPGAKNGASKGNTAELIAEHRASLMSFKETSEWLTEQLGHEVNVDTVNQLVSLDDHIHPDKGRLSAYARNRLLKELKKELEQAKGRTP